MKQHVRMHKNSSSRSGYVAGSPITSNAKESRRGSAGSHDVLGLWEDTCSERFLEEYVYTDMISVPEEAVHPECLSVPLRLFYDHDHTNAYTGAKNENWSTQILHGYDVMVTFHVTDLWPEEEVHRPTGYASKRSTSMRQVDRAS